jgi:hypothetical protein
MLGSALSASIRIGIMVPMVMAESLGLVSTMI